MHYTLTRRLLPGLTALLLTSTPLLAQDETATALETETQRLSYALGMDIAGSLQRIGMDEDLDIQVLTQAIEDVLAGREARLSDDEVQELKAEFGRKMQQKQMAQRLQQAEENQARSLAFLEENQQREGINTTESGLQYEVVDEGDGPKPVATDTVKVHYRGTLPDGTPFDSSYDRGEPATFPVNGVIAGWTEALQLMPVGSKYKLYIPPELAYGARGAGGRIGPNQALVFEVELLGIEE